MTQPTPPPQPTDGNPFAQQPAPVPPAPVPPAQGNVGLGLVTAVVVALVTALIYGAILKSTEYEIGYVAVGVGFAVGFAAGKVGGANPVLPIVSAVLSLGAVYAGQILGIAMIGADESGMNIGTILTDHFSLVTDVWSEEADVLTFVFLGIGAFAAFSGAKKAVA
ncbi:hypothetical protein HLK59_36750 [Streptomyces sp. S3(2020)]|uniref:hypothetical protein n=1 Tax=Streptomyces sp. S3(2020) TaxID=2732044 RepID=UPI001488B8CF|nr:hypothetical protein [Streptomyces sp. S3(2020)]NNN35818.1 hypothetical protein [Streptomyces sp. S3(2020)]